MDHEQQAAWMIRADADSDLTNSLDHCLTTLALAQGDPRNWKWVVIAAYSAAQTAMVMVLIELGDLEELTKSARKNLRAFLAKLDTDEAIPHSEGSKWKLDNFGELVKKCALLLPGGGVTHEMELGLNQLIYCRNHWTHFGVT